MKVLLALEDKVFGKAITDFVVHHSWRSGTIIRALHIVGWTLPERELLKSRTLMEHLEDEYARARELINATTQDLRAALKEVEIEEEIMEGDPARRILATAEAWGAHLIVVGSHSRQGMSLFTAGSVCLAVVSHARCSVAVVRLENKV
ncbi:MAG: universal stress protein [Candidatus Melainabacteria bacterium]|nr:universal stress protein [Candidatus Melainabacteria bacterium]